jgi:ABC-2 type transport system permease protein
MNYLYSLIIVFPALLLTGVTLTLNILWLPVILLITFLFTLGLSLILSALYVRFRDLEHIVGILVMVWFYLTPIVFGIEIFPADIAEIISYNPMVPIINGFRDILLYGQSPDWASLSYAFLIGFIVLIIGIFIFRKFERTFAEEL